MSRSIPEFGGLTVAVVGDLIADHYLVTEPRGLSREAPVMVLRHTSERWVPGGAANAARNAAALGARTKAVGVLGRDASGRTLVEALEADGVDVGAVATVPGWTTPTKTRIVSAEPRRNLQQVLRVDRDPAGPCDAGARARLRERVRALAGVADVVIVSDYEYGAVDAELAREVVALCQGGTLCVLDPRSRLDGFEGITALSPNVGELAQLTFRRPEALADARELSRAADEVLERTRARWLLVTRGNRGMALFGEGCPEAGTAVEASGQGNVTDVSGAGDTAAAVFALALGAGQDPAEAMVLANAASGVVVMENGAAVCTPAQLAAVLSSAPPATRIPGAGR